MYTAWESEWYAHFLQCIRYYPIHSHMYVSIEGGSRYIQSHCQIRPQIYACMRKGGRGPFIAIFIYDMIQLFLST